MHQQVSTSADNAYAYYYAMQSSTQPPAQGNSFYTQNSAPVQSSPRLQPQYYQQYVAPQSLQATQYAIPANYQTSSSSALYERKGLDLLTDPSPGCHPGYSIKVLMEYAIRGSATGRMSLSDIYEAVERRFPILKTELGSSWRNSARHDISFDPRFVKTPRLPSEPGKGSMWTFDPTVDPKPTKPRKKSTSRASADIVPPPGQAGMGRFRLNP